jgi:RNA polymerase sigma-70 factor (ECF subfamily)
MDLTAPAQHPGEMSAPELFTRLYETEFDAVWRFLHRLGARGTAVDDLAHDVFLHAHRKLSTYDVSRPARPWLFGIAFRVASDYRSLARHRHETADDAAPTAEATDGHPARAVEKREARDLVSAALAMIPLEQRAVLVMHELEERPVPEIAELMGTPLPTAYSRLRAARAGFAQAVTRIQGGVS